MAIPKALLWTTVAVLGTGAAVTYFGCKALGRAVLGDVAGLEAALPGEIKAARSEGLPISPEELFPNRPVPGERNAGPTLAVEVAQVAELVPADHAAIKALTAVANGTGGWQAERDLKEAVQLCAPHLKRIISETRKPECDFEKDYSLGHMVLFPEFANIKATVKVLCAKAWLDSKGNRFSEAESALAASFKLAYFSGQEPVLIGPLVHIACSAITHRHLRGIIAAHSKDARCLAMADRLSKVSDTPVNMYRAFHGELVGGLATIKTLKSLKEIEALSGEPVEQGSAPLDMLSGHMRRAWQTRLVQFWRRVFQRLPKNKLDFLNIRDVLVQETAKEESHKSLDYLMNKILFPVFDQAILAGCKERSDLAMTRATVALFKHRNTHGSFPVKLSELKGKFIDAFDNKPLRYRKTPAGFILYSIDRDLRDDGGIKLASGSTSGGPRDFVFEYP